MNWLLSNTPKSRIQTISKAIVNSYLHWSITRGRGIVVLGNHSSWISVYIRAIVQKAALHIVAISINRPPDQCEKIQLQMLKNSERVDEWKNIKPKATIRYSPAIFNTYG